MLTFERFEALAQSYGANLQRWPEEVRTEAQWLLVVSSQARRVLAEAQRLDDRIMAPAIRREPTPHEQVAALARLRSGVAARLAASVSPPRVQRTDAGWGGFATAATVAVVLGVLIGTTHSHALPPTNMLAILQPAPMQIFEQ